jgi:hypothetical protein
MRKRTDLLRMLWYYYNLYVTGGLWKAKFLCVFVCTTSYERNDFNNVDCVSYFNLGDNVMEYRPRRPGVRCLAADERL